MIKCKRVPCGTFFYATKNPPTKLKGDYDILLRRGYLEQSEMAITIKMKTLIPPPISNIKKF
jgi:hypothetical protein